MKKSGGSVPKPFSPPKARPVSGILSQQRAEELKEVGVALAKLGELTIGVVRGDNFLPPASMALELADVFLKAVQEAHANKAQLRYLSNRVEKVCPFLVRIGRATISDTVAGSVENLRLCLESCILQAQKYAHKNWFKRVIQAGTDKEKFQELNVWLNDAISQLDMGLGIEQTMLMQQYHEEEVRDKQDILSKMEELIKLEQESLQEITKIREQQEGFFLEQGEQNEILLLQMESIPLQVADNLALDKQERQSFLEAEFRKLHEEFRRLISQGIPVRQIPQVPQETSRVPPHLLITYRDLIFDKVLNRGSFGTVYLGQWCEVPVAIKKIGQRLPVREYEQFIREIEIMSKLRHPNITQLYGACMEPQACLVMEHVMKGSLDQIIENESWSIEEKIRVALDVAKGLAYMHYRDILHRDLKTGNILIDSRGVAKITDFGLCKNMGYSSGTLGVRSLDIQWMAPEVLDRAPHTFASDIYSYGIVLWSIVTGKKPYAGIEERVVMDNIRNGITESVPDDVPEPIKNIILQCWLREVTSRPALNDIIEQLKNFDPAPDLSPRTLCVRGMEHEDRRQYQQAYHHYLKAARGGFFRAQTNVATCLLSGVGCEKNKSAAEDWFLKAANQNHPRAQYCLGMMYERGDGVSANPERALYWYEAAARNNYEGAAEKASNMRLRFSKPC